MPFIGNILCDTGNSSSATSSSSIINISTEFAKILQTKYMHLANHIMYNSRFCYQPLRPAFVLNDVLYINTIINPSNVFTWYKYDFKSMTYTESTIRMDVSFGASSESNITNGDSTGNVQYRDYKYIMPIYKISDSKFWCIVARLHNKDYHRMIGAVIIDYATNTYTKIKVLDYAMDLSSHNFFNNIYRIDSDLYMKTDIQTGNYSSTSGFFKINTNDFSFTKIPCNDSLNGCTKSTTGEICWFKLGRSYNSSSDDPPIVMIYTLKNGSITLLFSTTATTTSQYNEKYDTTDFWRMIVVKDNMVDFKYPQSNLPFIYNPMSGETYIVHQINTQTKQVMIDVVAKRPNDGFIPYMRNNKLETAAINLTLYSNYNDGHGDDSYLNSCVEYISIFDYTNPGKSYICNHSSLTEYDAYSPIMLQYDISPILNNEKEFL